MAFECNPQQLELIKGGVEWFKHGTKQTLEVAGQAGTGKTTVIRIMTEALGLTSEEVLYMAYVGRAAQNLAINGLNAKTIHSSIYELKNVPKEDENGEIIYRNGRQVTVPRFTLRSHLPPEVKLLVVDEAGTVNEEMAADILSFGLPVIALGDLHQLKPVFGRAGFLHKPDYVLTQIMRQAEDSEIVYIADRILKGKPIEVGKYNTSNVLHFSDLTDEQMIASDMMLTIRNATRDDINEHMRNILGHTDHKRRGNELPLVVGEKVVCRRNNWKEYIPWENNPLYLINGMVGEVTGIDMQSFNRSTIDIDFKPDFIDFDEYTGLTIDINYLKTPAGKKYEDYPLGNLFQYGYAISTYMAQGSQYMSPMYFSEDIMPSVKKVHDYVGVTRARKRIDMVIPDPVKFWFGRN